jgi:predicted lipoprotein with Yx(FWY)xxD motif
MRARTLAGAAMLAVVLAACGSSGNSKSSSNNTATSGSSSSSTSPTSAAAATDVVKTASSSKFGTILVDSKGATLYTLTNNGQAAPCSSACLSVWPPLLLPSGVTTATGAGITGLGTTMAGGGTQVTHDGLPLYKFQADTAAGDVKGDGISSFGGLWHVVKVSGSATGTPSSTGGSSTSTGGSGY